MAKDFKEKIITVNLRRAFEKPVTKRAKSALFVLKAAIRKETRIDNIKITNDVNEEIWQNGLFKSLRKITVKVVKEEGGVRVYMPKETVIKAETKKTDKKPVSEKTKAEPKAKASKEVATEKPVEKKTEEKAKTKPVKKEKTEDVKAEKK
jgi:ribosomal protein L31E